jgi:CRISPR/Cas system CSM-associated protein Csm2 small subunit
MKLFEMFEPALEGYQDEEADNSKPIWKQSRKTKLTLNQIRKLRKMLDVRNYEKKNHLKKVHAQYGAKPDAETPTA